MVQDTYNIKMTAKIIGKPEDIMSLKIYEKIDKECLHSPKVGETLFVKIYNPYSCSGIELHRNNKTKYVLFKVRFYHGEELPKMYEVFKEHTLELPVLTCFQEYKKEMIKTKITKDIPIYCIIKAQNNFNYNVKIVKKDTFFEQLNIIQTEEESMF